MYQSGSDPIYLSCTSPGPTPSTPSTSPGPTPSYHVPARVRPHLPIMYQSGSDPIYLSCTSPGPTPSTYHVPAGLGASPSSCTHTSIYLTHFTRIRTHPRSICCLYPSTPVVAPGWFAGRGHGPVRARCSQLSGGMRSHPADYGTTGGIPGRVSPRRVAAGDAGRGWIR